MIDDSRQRHIRSSVGVPFGEVSKIACRFKKQKDVDLALAGPSCSAIRKQNVSCIKTGALMLMYSDGTTRPFTP